MKAKHTEFARGVPRAAKQASIFFFCGPDEAGASAAANAVIAALDDAGERIELSGSELRADPARLGDEARSSSLFGGARHILVRANGDDTHDALKALIETGEAGGGDAAPVIVVAMSATDKSRTAKLLEKRRDALVSMFYPPDPSSIAASVRAMADAAGLRLGGDLAESIARGARLDVRLAQSEVEKLALYLGADPQSPKTAHPQDYAAIGATSEEDGFGLVVNAVLGGDIASLSHEMRRVEELSINPVGLLLALERRAGQLVQIKARLGPRDTIQRLSRGEKAQLGIFWKEEGAIAHQIGRWNAEKLDRLIERLVALHRTLLTNSQASQVLLAQSLVAIARFAAKRV